MIWVLVVLLLLVGTLGTLSFGVLLVVLLSSKFMGRPGGNPLAIESGLASLREAFGTSAEPIRFDLGTTSITVSAYLPDRRDPGRLNVVAELPPAVRSPERGWEITLRRENALDKAGKLTLINREVQTGDASFDDRVYVESDAPVEVVREALADARVRTGAAALLDAGYARVRLLAGTNVWAQKDAPATGDFEPRRIEWTATQLAGIAGAIPALPARERVSHRLALGNVLMWLGVVGMPLSVIWLMWVLRLWPVLDHLPYLLLVAVGFAGWALSLPVLVLILRGRSDSFPAFLRAAGGLLLLFPSALPALVGPTNALLDTSKPADRTGEVRRTSSTSSRGAHTYYVHVRFAGGNQAEKIRVDEKVWDGANNLLARGTPASLTVAVHEGLFGWAWYDDVRLEQRRIYAE